MRRIEVQVEGIVMGFASDDETDELAQARLILEAEVLANQLGNPRLHLRKQPEVEIVKSC